MKKFFANVIIVVAVLTTALVAVPFNALHWLGYDIPVLMNNEIYIKGGIGAAMFLFSFIYLILSMVEYKRTDHVSRSTAFAAFVPMFLFTIFALGFAAILAVFLYRGNPTTTNLIYLGGTAAVLLNLGFIGHLISLNFRQGKNLRRILLFFLLIELMGASGFLAYTIYGWTQSAYLANNYYTLYYVGAIAVALVFYIIHLIVISVRGKNEAENAGLEEEIKEIRKGPEPEKTEVREEKPVVQKPVAQKPAKLTKAEKNQMEQEQIQSAKGKKTTIVSKEQAIISGEQNVDPTNLLYEEVNVDPEFNKTSNLDKQVSSIEYYIEKPKMFKPLDPAFDVLVSYVRELPNVVTKISDERISFYVDRKPFLVLMNFGNYYRMAFRSDLEKGVRLIIKYPTISKNKGTKDTLWFKANNYGDLPKEVIYDIVKSAFDNVNA